MKKWIASKVDIEIYNDFHFRKFIRVLFFDRKVAEFVIEQGSSKINRSPHEY